MIKEVEGWIQQLSNNDMPVFSGTVTEVTSSVNSDNSSASDVAHTILKDASLTGRLLKMANSPHYNPGRYTITTVTRAVMVLGFDQVRALAVSLILIDSVENEANREKMAEEMAQAFHAAVQAEDLATLTGIKAPEDVFVATLLSRLGNMAFWAFSGEQGSQLQNVMSQGVMTSSEAEIAVLGFSLNSLSKGLSKAWSLGELLDKSFNASHADDPLVNLIHMGQNLAEATKNGWNEEQAHEVILQVAKKLNISQKDIESRVHKNAKRAKSITKDYGIAEASKHIPLANVEVDALVSEPEPDELTSEVLISDVLEQQKEKDSDVEDKATLQLSVLQEISEAIEEKPSINVIIEMVLEGIMRGINMDRALFTILSKDHKTLICKYALGEGTESFQQKFKIDISHDSNIFAQVVESHKAILIPANPKEINGTVNKVTLDLLGFPPYLIMPTVVKGKVIGVFIADRDSSNGIIERKDFLAFQQFCEKASMGLTFLSMQD